MVDRPYIQLILKITRLQMFQYLKYLWALPITLLGLLLLFFALPSRPRIAWLSIGDTKALCVWDGWPSIWLKKHPMGSMLAITLGHVVIASNARQLCFCGAHEFEHVRQTELWGIILPFAYVANGLWQWAHGKQFYRNNYFEERAYCFTPERFTTRLKKSR